MKKKMLAINGLVMISLLLGLSGFVRSSAVLAADEQAATPSPNLPEGVFYFPAQPDAVFQPPAPDPNLVASGVGAPPSLAAAAAGVDDRDNTDITAWYVYEHQTLAQVMSTAGTNNLRVVDLYVENPVSPYQFTAVYVSNTGSYAKSFYILVNVTPTTLLNFVNTNAARIVVLKAFNDPAGSVFFFAVMISNTGADFKNWWFWEGQTTASLNTFAATNNARITQINSYVKNGVTLYAAVLISNTGADARSWWWYANVSVGTISTALSTNNARLIDLDIGPAAGNYNAVMVSCATGCPMWWWWVDVSTANLLNTVLQDGARIIDANSVSGCGDRCWSILLINNSNPITSRVGEMLRSQTDGTMGLLLKQVGGPVLANLMDGVVYEPASAIKVLTHLYTMRQVQAGSVTLSTPIPSFTPPIGSSCPGTIVNGSESIDAADLAMMWHSDNTRARELNDFFGTTNINLMAANISMTNTSINHVLGCGGPIPNQTTLDDMASLYEGVANATLLNAANRNVFFNHTAGKAEFNTEGYDWTGLWSTDIPAILKKEAPHFVTQAQLNTYQSQMDLAYKAGNYNLCTTTACTSLIYHIAISGWAKIPFCDAGGPRQFVFGTFINNATSSTASAAAFNSTKTELLREQIHAGLASCFHAIYMPTVSR